MTRKPSSLAHFAVPLLALAGCTAGPSVGETGRQITNGDAVEEGEFPTIGGISTNAGSVCTGTLVSPTAVLTAAHCVEPNLLKQAMEQAGQEPPDEIVYKFTFSRDLRGASEENFLEVESVEWHDQFLMDFEGISERPGRWHDIAVMHLAEPVTDRPVQELAPADVVEALELDRTHAVAGYGQTDDEDMMSAGTLMKGMSGLDERGEHELIAGVDDEQQACRGDSGGPIFADESDTFQIGIASRVNADLFPPPSEPPPCDTGLLYTRVDTYRSWIEERVPDLGEGSGDGDPDDPNDPDDGGDGDGGGGGGGDMMGTGGGCAAAPGSGGAAGAGLLLVGALIAQRRRRR